MQSRLIHLYQSIQM